MRPVVHSAGVGEQVGERIREDTSGFRHVVRHPLFEDGARTKPWGVSTIGVLLLEMKEPALDPSDDGTTEVSSSGGEVGSCSWLLALGSCSWLLLISFALKKKSSNDGGKSGGTKGCAWREENGVEASPMVKRPKRVS